jgi:opacity protein-like surface antigen
MKKIFLIAFSLSLLFSGAYAQKGKEIVLGVGGGVTSVWIVNQSFYGEPEVDYAPKMGYAASINLGYNFNKSISVMTELQYSLQGQKYDGKQNMGGTSYNVERNINLGYFNIPLLFKYAFGSGGTKFRFLVGPQVGILMDASQEYLRNDKKIGSIATDQKNKPFVTDDNEITDRFEKTDFSLVVDIGADIHLSDLFFISAGIRGNYGLSEINAEPYRINNLDGEYLPSNNLWGGVYVGICYKLDVQGYSQRSF